MPHKQETVALLLGGVGEQDAINHPTALKSVELFGCKSSPRMSISMYPFPVNVIYAGVLYIPPDTLFPGSHMGVLVCGGFSCSTVNDCIITDACYFWDPSLRKEEPGSGWQPFHNGNLTSPRWNHLMALGPDTTSGSNRKVPISLGLNEHVDIYDYVGGEWRNYLDLPVRDWAVSGCLFQYNYSIYHLRTEIIKLDLFTWELSNYGKVPELLANPGRCAATKVDGEFGNDPLRCMLSLHQI